MQCTSKHLRRHVQHHLVHRVVFDLTGSFDDIQYLYNTRVHFENPIHLIDHRYILACPWGGYVFFL